MGIVLYTLNNSTIVLPYKNHPEIGTSNCIGHHDQKTPKTSNSNPLARVNSFSDNIDQEKLGVINGFWKLVLIQKVQKKFFKSKQSLKANR